MNFTIENFYNPHLSLGSSRIDSIISITASNNTGEIIRNNSARVVIFMLDVSGSMAGDRLAMGKIAVRKCIDLLDEKSSFAVIAFESSAKTIIPLTLATESAKQRAHEKIKRLSAGGGTEMSKALLAVLNEIDNIRNIMCYAQFVTDGENNSTDRKALEVALSKCEGKFQCDCWGVGTDWQPDDLRKISSRLLGTADAVPNPEKLEEHFKNALAQALSKGIADVRLRLQTPKSSKIVTIKQMRPEIADLSKLAKKVDDKNLDIPLGAWGEESRDYHVAFELQPQEAGEEMMACRPKVVYSMNGQEVIKDGERIVATWSMDDTLTSRINAQVAHYTGQEELANSIKEGLEAKARGDIDSATVLLGKAAKIAIESGNEEVTMRLKKVVDVIDADQGTVRLKSNAGKAEELELDMGGTRTIRRRQVPVNKEGI